MKTIFLDVGSHIGQTLEEVIKDKYNFDEIHCFEPSQAYHHLQVHFDHPNLHLHNIGLSNSNKVCDLFNPGHCGGSIFYDKPDNHLAGKPGSAPITLKNTSEWLQNNLNLKDDVIFMKINCEGCECDIIEDMIDNNVYDYINHIMVDFDVRKIPSQQHREHEIMELIKDKTNIDLCDNVMIGDTHQARIGNWLNMYEI